MKTRINIAIKSLHITTIALYLLSGILLLILSGCYETQMVKIKVRVDSKVDMSKYQTIAVMDFVDKKIKPNEMNGKIIARLVRKQLKKGKGFQVLEERNMEFGSSISRDDIKDPMIIAFIGRQLDVDALIVGEFEFYQRYQSVPYIAERYSTSTGRYAPEGRSYIQKVYGLSLKAMVVDCKSGETVFTYTPRIEERPEYRNTFSLPFSDGTSDPSNLRSMVAKPVNNFVLSLMPHYEKQRRLIIK